MTEDKMSQSPEGDDNETLLDQCAMECMEAIEQKDKSKFLEAFQVLVADLLSKMSSDESKE